MVFSTKYWFKMGEQNIVARQKIIAMEGHPGTEESTLAHSIATTYIDRDHFWDCTKPLQQALMVSSPDLHSSKWAFLWCNVKYCFNKTRIGPQRSCSVANCFKGLLSLVNVWVYKLLLLRESPMIWACGDWGLSRGLCLKDQVCHALCVAQTSYMAYGEGIWSVLWLWCWRGSENCCGH